MNKPDDTGVIIDNMIQLFKFYKGKPTVYLDHNILNKFVDNKMQNLFNRLKEEYQVVYSDENLKEIKRSGGDYSKQFLDVLNSLNAYRLKHIVKPSNVMTSELVVSICNITPHDAFKDYMSTGAYDSPEANAFLSLSYEMFGGNNNNSLEEVKNLALKGCEDIANIPKELFDIFMKGNSSFEDKFKVSPEVFEIEYKRIIEEANSLLEPHKPADGENWPGVEGFRKYFGVGAMELNNIYPPDVLLKIWELYKDKEPSCKYDHSFDNFFLIKVHPIYPDKKYYNFEKVNTIYSVLNMIGYYSDKGAYKNMNRFISAFSDMGHASAASFTSTLFSCDKNFIKKTEAAYEYLDINTNIVNPDIKK